MIHLRNANRFFLGKSRSQCLAQQAKKVSLIFSGISVSTVLAAERPAQAVLIYNIYESGSDVIVDASGSLNVGVGVSAISCLSAPGSLFSFAAAICTGDTSQPLFNYALTGGGPNSFGTGGVALASLTSGLPTFFVGGNSIFRISQSYVSGDPIVASSTYSNTSLSALGITSTGLLGTWTLVDTSDTIEVRADSAPVPVPGPLPLLGVGAAFGYSRRLRRRINLSTGPLSTA